MNTLRQRRRTITMGDVSNPDDPDYDPSSPDYVPEDDPSSQSYLPNKSEGATLPSDPNVSQLNLGYTDPSTGQFVTQSMIDSSGNSWTPAGTSTSNDPGASPPQGPSTPAAPTPYGPPSPSPSPSPSPGVLPSIPGVTSNTLEYLLIGAAALGVVVLIKKKRAKRGGARRAPMRRRFASRLRRRR